MADTNIAWGIPAEATSPPVKLNKITLPKPTPGPHQVLIQIHGTALNYRDLLVATRSPTYPGNHVPDLVPLSDGAGIIESTGTDSRWSAGDRIIVHPATWLTGDIQNLKMDKILGACDNHGTLQRYMVLDDDRVILAPKNLTLEESGALVTAAGTVINTFFFGPVKVKTGDWVLTQGTGGVSVFAIQIASALGCTVIATSSSDEKLEEAKKFGAKHVINYKNTPDWDEEVLRITGGRGVDHVVEVGGSQTIVKSLNSTRFGGCVTVLGILTDPVATDLIPHILYGAKILRGSLSQSREVVEEMVRVLEKYDIHPVIAKTYEFDEAPEAFEALRKQIDIGKIVIKGPR